ncbi:MAG: OmpA family protein [Aeromicrobium sp.]|nr:OmpA family protein [Burkholderiales bacterium]
MKLKSALGKRSVVAIALLASFVSPIAMAQEAGWYGGLNFGQSKAKIDDPRIIGGLLSSGFFTTSITDDDRESGYKIFGGYQMNRHLAVEAGYFDLGRFGFNAITQPLGSLTGEIKIRGANLDLVGVIPLTEKFSVFGRVGVARAEARDTFTGSGLVRVLNPNPSKTDTNGKYGLGLQYAFTESFGLRAEVERYRIDDAVGNKGDIDLASLGLVYRFGKNRPAPTYVARATEPTTPVPRVIVPEPIAAAPIALPPIAPAVIPSQQPRRVTFSADALFDFDKATIKPAGMRELDKFVADVRGTIFDVISVTGHTDRIGSDAYNMALSARRAETVKSYLVSPAGLPSGKITARGAGETNPITKPADCKGTRPAQIACLQPDRRVVVEVSGTK